MVGFLMGLVVGFGLAVVVRRLRDPSAGPGWNWASEEGDHEDQPERYGREYWKKL